MTRVAAKAADPNFVRRNGVMAHLPGRDAPCRRESAGPTRPTRLPRPS